MESAICLMRPGIRFKGPYLVWSASMSRYALPDPCLLAVQQFLGSSQPTERFAAVRVLSSVVAQHPAFVAPCSTDLEMLIQDQNRSIATLAVTTLVGS